MSRPIQGFYNRLREGIERVLDPGWPYNISHLFKGGMIREYQICHEGCLIHKWRETHYKGYLGHCPEKILAVWGSIDGICGKYKKGINRGVSIFIYRLCKLM